jgi:internalin A
MASAQDAKPGIEVEPSGQVIVRHVTQEGLQQVASAENKNKLTFFFAKTAKQEDFDAVLKKFDWIEVVSFEMWNPNIANINAVSNLRNLRELRLLSLLKSKEAPVDLAPLAKLTSLTKLTLYDTQVTNVSALNGLVNMEVLSLYMSAVDSIDFLTNMPKLRDLNLYGADHTFKNYAPISGLANVEKLGLYMNPQATDANLQALLPLTRLRKLDLSFTEGVTNLNFLKNSVGLEQLTASNSKNLADIGGLEGARNLQVLGIRKTQVTSLEPIRGNENLRSLDISETRIGDSSPLASAKSLRILIATQTKITDISSVFGLRELARLEVDSGVPDEQIKKLKTLLPQVTVVKN